jgi:hypothetical protein
MSQYTEQIITDLLIRFNEIEKNLKQQIHFYEQPGMFDIANALSINSVTRNTVQKLYEWRQDVNDCLECAKLYNEKEKWNDIKIDRNNFKNYVERAKVLLTSILAGISNQTSVKNQPIFDIALVEGTGRKYIDKFAKQANICYENECYDACMVMLRRLIEVLIIDCFEVYKLQDKIKGDTGHYFFLKDLIYRFFKEENFTKSRNIDKYLQSLKKLGDIGSHGKSLVQKQDIDQAQENIRFCIQELLSISGLSLKK